MCSEENRMTSLTDAIIEIAMRPASQVPNLPLDFAKLSLFDWMTCGIAGTNEPLAVNLRQLAAGEGATLASVLVYACTPRGGISEWRDKPYMVTMTHILPMLGIWSVF